LQDTLGEGYTRALRGTYKISKHHAGVPDSADFVMYWWFKAAQLMSLRSLRRFGFVTTNSIKQTFNRRVIEEVLSGGKLSLLYAVPDHPWVDEQGGAAVRIAMTVVGRGQREGVIERVVSEQSGENGEYSVVTVEETGRINADLTVGADTTGAVELEANADISSRGVQLMGAGFIVTREEAAALGLGRIDGLEKHIREYRNGRDLMAQSRGVMVIDLFGLSEADVFQRFPEVYQHVKLTVKPERDQNNRASYRDNWWIFGEARSAFRPALDGLPRYIATVATSKHRVFQFLEAVILPDDALIVIAHDDAYVLGVLSSRVHVVWSLAQGGTLEDRPRYNKTRCFETFPFPTVTAAQQRAIREGAQALDDHRKARLALHPDLSMTGLYNVLEKLRSGAELSAAEQDAHSRGLVSTLRGLHDDLDGLVAEAYGWPFDLPTPEVLARLAALNTVRAAEERSEIVNYLRPAYQNPNWKGQEGLLAADEAEIAAAKLPMFPKRLAEQSQAVRQLLRAGGRPLTPQQVARAFRGVRASTTEEVLEMLVSLGQAREVPLSGGYTA
uniref:type IIL restriction-modification enzyme MmeI n=1 Tax=Deinococcus sp. TaxID=47478 RepID=UPI003450DAA0